MREQYCIHTIEKIRSRTVIRMTKQQEMFRVSTPSFAGHKGLTVSLKLCLNL